MKKCGSVMVGLFVVFLMASCSLFPWNPIYPGPEPEPLPIDTGYVYESYTLNLGDTVTFSFASNGSTGYRWQWDNQASVSVVDSLGFEYITYDANDGVKCDVIGAGGTEVWKFLAVEPGTEILQFSYVRPWEVGIEAADSRKIEITVLGTR